MYSHEENLIQELVPLNISNYLLHRGWKKRQSLSNETSIFRLDGKEIVIPIARNLAEYEYLMGRAVEKIAEFDQKDRVSIINALLLPSADVICFKLDDLATKEGFISLANAPKYIESCQKAILAAACYVEEPKKHYPKLSKATAKTYLSKCKLNTKPGSFVVNVICPQNAVDENVISDNARLLKEFPEERFSRTVTRTLLLGAKKIVETIDSGDLSLIDNSNNFPVSSNFCKALLGMSPQNEGSSLTITGTSNFGESILDTPSIRINKEYFDSIEILAARLTPSSTPEAKFFTGLITDLHGERTESGSPAGDVEISFQYDDEEIIKARLTLNVQTYSTALEAHKYGHYVSFNGTLRMGIRSHRITDISNFRDIQAV